MSFPARHTPEAEAELVALLADPALDGHAFLDAYRAWRYRHRRGGEPHEPRAIAVAATILAAYPRVVQANVRELLGGTLAQARAAQQAVCARLGQAIPLQQHVNIECAGATQTLLDWLRRDLSMLPETCLDADAADLYPVPGDRYSARVLALCSAELRLTAALHLLLASADRMKPGRITRYLQGWESLDRWAAQAGAGERVACHARVPEAMLAWLSEESSQNRLDFWCLLAEATRRLERYLRVRPEIEQRVGLNVVHVPLPCEYQAARELGSRIRARSENRRSATADPLADDYRKVLHLADVRFAEVAAVRDAFDAACAELDAGRAATRHFAVTLPRTALDGSPLDGTRTLEFEILLGDDLARRFAPLVNRPPHRAPARWLLAYRGVRDQQDIDDFVPVFEAHRIGVFLSPQWRTDADEHALHEFRRRIGSLPIASGLTLFHYRSGRDAQLAGRAFGAGIVLIPIEIVHHAFAVARAIARTGLLCGARLGETLQQAWDTMLPTEEPRPGAMEIMETPEPQVRFWAKPKGRAGLSCFYLDAETITALATVVQVAERNGWSIAPIIRHAKAAAGPRRYLYQRDGIPLDGNQVNAALQVLLFGYRLTSHDLRHAFGRFAGAQGVETRAVQASLHQAQPAVTYRYMKSTEEMKADLARLLAASTASPWLPKYPTAAR